MSKMKSEELNRKAAFALEPLSFFGPRSVEQKTWFVPRDETQLASPYEAADRAAESIKAAEPFVVSLRSMIVSSDHEDWFRGKNDIMISSSTSYGDGPSVRRLHYFEEELPTGEFVRPFLAENVFLCEDYSGIDRLFMEIEILEIDTNDGERAELVKSASDLALTAGAIFPVIMPYVAIGSTIATAVEKLISAFERDTRVLRERVALEPPERMGALLRPGTYVLFAEPVDGTAYQLAPGFMIKGPDVEKLTYVTLTVEPVKAVSPQFVVSARLASLLTRMQQKSNGFRAAIDAATEVMKGYSDFRTIQRYYELQRKQDPTDEERRLMDEIEARSDLEKYLPKKPQPHHASKISA